MRSGYYNTSPLKFQAGDLVYVRRPSAAVNLQGSVRNGIYRVKEVRASGTLLIYGQCGSVAEVHCTNCAPCHLTNINPAMHTSTFPCSTPGSTTYACQVRYMQDRPAVMVICDSCTSAGSTWTAWTASP